LDEKFYVFTFYSTHSALEFENKLKENNFDIKLIPVPRKISSSCGLAGRVNNNYKDIKQYCDKNDIKYGSIYKISPDNNAKKIF
jgi:hypothetical protein